MGKYTQTIHEFMSDLNLDPFERDDRVKAAKRLGMTAYPEVDENVMDNLFDNTVLTYMFNEFGSASVDTFRLNMMQRMQKNRQWFTQMYDAYKDLLPYDILESESSSQSDSLTINSREGQRDATTYANNKSDSFTLSNADTYAHTDSNTTNSDETNTEHSEDGRNKNIDTSNTEGGEFNGHVTSGSSTEKPGVITTVGNENKVETKGDSADGFGTISDFSRQGSMIEKSRYDGRVDETKGATTTSTEGENVTATEGKDHGASFNHNDSINKAFGKTHSEGKNKSVTEGGTEASSTNTQTNHQTADATQSGFNDSTSSDTSKEDSKADQKGNTTTKTSGLNVWKPELAKKFYDQFVSIENEFVEDLRPLFMLIY